MHPSLGSTDLLEQLTEFRKHIYQFWYFKWCKWTSRWWDTKGKVWKASGHTCVEVGFDLPAWSWGPNHLSVSLHMFGFWNPYPSACFHEDVIAQAQMEHRQPRGNVTEPHRHNLLPTDRVGKPRKACSFSFFSSLWEAVLPCRYGAEPLRNRV